jgi:hypothetical protein
MSQDEYETLLLKPAANDVERPPPAFAQPLRRGACASARPHEEDASESLAA